ncbi:MAG: sortase [Dehalococcoidia bacterium]|nr:sortase [Dehalococcoidia bacterium]
MRARAVYGTLAAVALLVLGFLYWSGSGGDSSEPARASAPGTGSGASPDEPAVFARESGGARSPTATPEPTPLPRSQRGIVPVRVTFPTNGIDAPVIEGDVDARINQMVPPDSATDVAWYDYSALPGEGGNAVFAGHVDLANYGPAVFWALRNADPGDLVQVVLSDGALLTYSIEFTELYPAVGGPWNELFSPQIGTDALTIYTCEGNFADGEYDQRRVVRAVLVDVQDGAQPS